MKNAVKYFNLVFLIFTFIFSFANADIASPKEMYADICIVDFAERKNQTEILLSNGSSWIYSDSYLFDGFNSWKIGDRVRMIYSGYLLRDEYYLQNMSRMGYAPVKIAAVDNETKRIQNIESVFNSNNVLIANDITLNDHSKWHVGQWSSNWMKDWQIGDRIAISPADFILGKATHLLINLDQLLPPHSQNSANVRAELQECEKIHRASQDNNIRDYPRWDISVQDIEADGTGLMIRLTNGAICYTNFPTKHWKKDDEVTFFPEKDDIKIKNLNCDESLTVLNIEANIFNFWITKITNKGRIFTLDDDFVWYSQDRHFVKRWNVDDRVIVLPLENQPSVDMSTHLLVNLDVVEENKCDVRRVTLIK